MRLAHIMSDCRQLLRVFLGHPHPRKVAVSSARALAMQGDALLSLNLAGRCDCLQFTRRRHAPHVTQPVVDCALLACGSLDDYHHLIGSRASLGRSTDGGFRTRGTNCGQFVLLSTSGEVSLLSGRHNFALGKACSSFGTSGDVSHQNRGKLFWGIIFACATGVAYSAVLRTKICAGRLLFACLVRLKSGSRFN